MHMSRAAWERLTSIRVHQQMFVFSRAEVALAQGHLVDARRWADQAASMATGRHLVLALTTRARVAIAEAQPDAAERDAHAALALAAKLGAHLGVPNILECLAAAAGAAGSHDEAARLLGAAAAIPQHTGCVRFKVHDADYEATVAKVRNAMSDRGFDSGWDEGASLSTEEAIAYAQRGRGERKRPSSGWAALTPTERDVVRLLSEGLANKDIATRLSSHPGPWKPISPTSIPSSASPPVSNWRNKQHAVSDAQHSRGHW
jgi:ATP/maltotriose-dependent transcriptional regulator MalT